MSKSSLSAEFSDKLLVWFDQHGRKSLPWHRNRDPYQIWVSEIMLQQTQVKAVIPYFERFIERFPTISALASAGSDTVMHNWAGLGYYARARNLHKASKQIIANHESKFPENFDDLVALPGIGRSTAGAILAFCFSQRHAILDGNVKRVLTRIYAVEGYPGKKEIENQLWHLAETLTPEDRVGDYTQAIMDLGATLCTRNQPACGRCPFFDDCRAQRSETQHLYPFRKPKSQKKQKKVKMLVLRNNRGEILLEKRPEAGIWGGLWSLPECDHGGDTDTAVSSKFGFQVLNRNSLPELRHSFTHFDLQIHPELVEIFERDLAIMDGDHYLWYNLSRPQTLGLPVAITKIIESMVDRTD